jgi:glycosyltransferase involved in cell wall biosynthesis
MSDKEKMNKSARIIYELGECGAFLIRLIADVFRRVKRPRAQVSRVAVVSRADIFPANHGGAVKIVKTAKYLSFHYDEVLVITQSRYDYYVFRNGEVSQCAYPLIARLAFWIPFSYLWRKIDSTGVPQSERFLALPFCDRNFKFRVLYLAVRRPFDVMQAEFSPFVFACDWASRVYPDLPKIAVEHNIEFLRLGATYNLTSADIEKIKNYELEACRSSDRIVVVSDVDRDLLIDGGVETSRISVIPLGVDLSEFGNGAPEAASSIRRQYGLVDDDFIIMFHGVLHYKPNLDAVRLIAREIMPRLRSRGSFVKCLVIGNSPPAEYAADDIILTGPVDRLPPYIQAADVAVIPLLEGGGTRLKIMEYFAAGVPVISTRKGAEGIKAEEGKDILIEDSMDAIAKLIGELRDDAVKRRTIGENGRQFAQGFGWDRLAVDYCRLYTEVAQLKLS